MALKVLTPCPLTRVSATHAQCLLLQPQPLPEAACRACLLTLQLHKRTTATDNSTTHHHCSPLTSRDQTPVLKIARSTDKVAMSRARWGRLPADHRYLALLLSKTRSLPTAIPAKAMSMCSRVVMRRSPSMSPRLSTLMTGALMTTVTTTTSTTTPSFHLSSSLSTLIFLLRWLGLRVTKVRQGDRRPEVPPQLRRTIPLRVTIRLPADTAWVVTGPKRMAARAVTCTDRKPT